MSKIKSDNFQRHWGWLLGLGIIFIILGCIGVGATVAITLATIFLIGIILLIAGIAQFIDVFKSKKWQGALWHGVIALLYLIAATLIFRDPILASTVFTAILAWILITIGLLRLIMAASLRKSPQWGWLVVAGLAAIILGILILIQWPASSLWIIGLLISIELLVSGWSYVFMALAIPKS